MTESIEPSRVQRASAISFGRYVLERKIAHGGMAEVFLGKEKDAEPGVPPLIIKCILYDIASDPQFLAMFINEAQLAAQMDHPNIVRVLDFGEYNGRLFMVMEYVDGLDCWRFARRLYPWGEDHTALAVWMICQVLMGLEHVHGLTDVNGRSLNVVHRDMSPSNIYLSRSGAVKISDFGIARIESKRYRPIAMVPRGKFGYVAPEQVEALTVDHRADLFSVGVVLAELLIGKKIFTGHSQLSVLLDIKDARLSTLEQNVDRVDPRLLEILKKALARDPDERYTSAAEFRAELTEVLDARPAHPGSEQLAVQVARALELRDSESLAPDRIWPQTPEVGEIASSDMDDDRQATGKLSLKPGNVTEQQIAEIRTADFDQLPSYSETPITGEATPYGPVGRYVVKLPNGQKIGPTSFAHLMELIYSDQVSADTLISIDGDSFIPASEIPDLTRHLPIYTPTRDVDGLEKPDRRGLLHLESPSEIMLALAVRDDSGLFICQKGSSRKEVYFRKGRAVYVGSNDPSELLGEHLVAHGVLERAEVDLALAILPRFNGHLGDTLIALGMLSAVELFNHIGTQIKNRFTTLLGWRRGRYEFYKDICCRPNVLEVPVDLFSSISDHLVTRSKELDAPSIISKMRDVLISPSRYAGALCQRTTLPKAIEACLNTLTGPSTVELWMREVNKTTDQEEMARSLFVGIEAGIWKVDEPSILPWRAAEADESNLQ